MLTRVPMFWLALNITHSEQQRYCIHMARSGRNLEPVPYLVESNMAGSAQLWTYAWMYPDRTTKLRVQMDLNVR